MESPSRPDAPAHNGRHANQNIELKIDSAKPFDYSDSGARSNRQIHEQILATPTVAEIVQKAGFRTAIAGSKPWCNCRSFPPSRNGSRARINRVIERVSAGERWSRDHCRRRSFPIRTGYLTTKKNAWTTALDEFSEGGRAEIFPSLAERTGSFRT